MHITVKVDGGSSSTSTADLFTYIAPQPSVSGVSPNQGPTIGGPSVTISGSYFSAATAVAFGGVAASSFTVEPCSNFDHCPITAMPPPQAAGTVHVTVTTSGGTSTTSSADEYTYVAGQAAIIFNASSVNFSNRDLGTSADPTTVTLTNTGNAVLIITAIDLIGANPGEFAIGEQTYTAAQIQPNGTCSIPIRFRPPWAAPAPPV